MIIRTVIIDDEEKSVHALSNLLGRYCQDIEVVGKAGSAARAIEVINEKKPDLVFLDILMPDGTGFDVLEKSYDGSFGIVFATAFEEHALRAFHFSALHYLLKPINFLELQTAVERFREHRNETRSLLHQNVDIAKTYYNLSKVENIVLPSLDGFSVVKVADIIRCEADSNYTKIIFSNSKPFLASRSLVHFEELLNGLNFIRVHHKHLINLGQVKRYHKGRGGYVEMSDGHEVEVSTRKKEEFLAAIAAFTRGAY